MIPASWLSGIFGSNSQAASMGSAETLAYYKQQVASGAKEMERVRKDPAVARDLARLDRAIAKAKTPDDLLKDPEATRILLQGLGLADQTQNTGLARRALTSDPKDKKSLANQLSDTRWLSAAKQLDFSASGLAKLKDASIRKVVEDGLVKYKYLTGVSERSQAVADALYLREQVMDEPPDAYDVLGNSVLRRIATTVAAIPRELALQQVEAQARTLTSRFDLKLMAADGEKREKLIQRYLAISGANASSAAASQDLSALAVGARFGRINTLA
jgi:hypothetical protein